MLMQFSFELMTIVYILLATIFLFLMLWLASRLIIGKEYTHDKRFMLLIASLLIVVLVPLVTGGIMFILNLLGGLLADLRNLITPGGGNAGAVGMMAPIIAFLLFILILRFLCSMDWRDTIWVSLIGIFLLYLLYALLPELNFFTVS